MSHITGKIKNVSSKEISYEDNSLIDEVQLPAIIRFKNKDGDAILNIEKIENKKIILKTVPPFVLEDGSAFDILKITLTTKDKKIVLNDKIIDTISIKKDSSKNNIKLIDDVKKLDNIYKDYWIIYNNEFRKVKEYKNNELTLYFDLSDAPKENENIGLLQHVFNDYIILGIDFTNFIGMNFSSLIDSVGGVFNFQITTGILCCCCILIISILIMSVSGKKPVKRSGVFLPGIGQLGAQQPLIIQMPMQTQPYSFPNSPFPRYT